MPGPADPSSADPPTSSADPPDSSGIVVRFDDLGGVGYEDLADQLGALSADAGNEDFVFQKASSKTPWTRMGRIRRAPRRGNRFFWSD